MPYAPALDSTANLPFNGKSGLSPAGPCTVPGVLWYTIYSGFRHRQTAGAVQRNRAPCRKVRAGRQSPSGLARRRRADRGRAAAALPCRKVRAGHQSPCGLARRRRAHRRRARKCCVTVPQGQGRPPFPCGLARRRRADRGRVRKCCVTVPQSQGIAINLRAALLAAGVPTAGAGEESRREPFAKENDKTVR